MSLTQSGLQKPQVARFPDMRRMAGNWQRLASLKTYVAFDAHTVFTNLLKYRTVVSDNIACMKNMIVILHKAPLSPVVGLGRKSYESLNG